MKADVRSDRGRVLVTGLDGFTGHHVGPLLRERGYEVIRATEPEFDLRRPETIESAVQSARPDYVIHLGGISFVAHHDAAALYAVNTVGTTSLLHALERISPNVRKVILASTSQVYGNAADDPIAEDTPVAPISHYACSKLAMEYMARARFDKLPIVITRPFNCIGVGQAEQFLLPKLVDHFKRRATTIELGNLDVERDFIDVRCVADAYVRLLESSVHSQVLNIASGVGRSLTGIIDDLARITGHHLTPRTNPALIRDNEVKRLVGSGTRLSQAIGVLQYSDFETTLRWMLNPATQSG